MNDIFYHLRNPVRGESDEYQQTDDFGRRTGAGCCAGGAGGVVFGVDCNECYGEPGAKGCGNEATDHGDDEDVAIVFRNINYDLQHEDREGDTWYPCYEADDIKDRED